LTGGAESTMEEILIIKKGYRNQETQPKKGGGTDKFTVLSSTKWRRGQD